MVFVAAKVFLVNVICAIVPCDPNYGQPKISKSAYQPPSIKDDFSVTTIKSGRSITSYTDGENEIQTQIGAPPLINPSSPIVQTKSGTLEGYLMTIISGKAINAFEGIPYAEAPVGHLRFRSPVPKTPWTGIRQAKDPGPLCMQFHLRKIGRIVGSEDCLSLNVYTPMLPYYYTNYNPKLAVIVYIHGGAFIYGSGSEHGPSYLLKEDVILVTVNYRQGVLGFLSTGDYESPGNYGLKDIGLALQWVSENIQNFGGDPRRVTLMGQSGGGVCSHLMLMSKYSNLFQGVIIQSGTAFNHWGVSPYSKSFDLTKRLAQKLGCKIDLGTKIMLECIRGANSFSLIYHQQRLHDFLVFPPVLFGPVIELPGPDAILTDTPEAMYEQNKVARIPLIISQTSDEADSVLIIINSLGFRNYFLRNWEQFSPYILDYAYVASNQTEITQRMREHYMGKRDPLTATIREISDVASDRYFRVGIHKAMQMHSQIAPTYGFLFGFKSEIGVAANWGLDPQDWGVGHSEDNAYIFNASLYFKPVEEGQPEYQASSILNNLIATFAQKREPYLVLEKGDVRRIWEPIKDPAHIRLLQLDNDHLRMVAEPRTTHIKFWESLDLKDAMPYTYSNVFLTVDNVK